ncbi:DUF4998 domain-containing protein [Snuella sedimenti]|uniref:DUF4998 domain-containing protein n=1 Tax=Snuella sedimenti TaxID=2798802 RepID=A0A8J7JE49_9FLAO|nr:DUF4998 domain-containing protein [Snuella sedimenti]MBJ6369604.1 hypothetical protein [Snuella sedimenti]
MRNFLIINILAIALYSCTDINDEHQEYLDKGENIYTEKPDSLIVSPGFQRAKLQWFLYSDTSIKKARVFWNAGKDSLDVNISVNPQVKNVIEVIVPNLDEGVHTFAVLTLDGFDNKSIPVSIGGRVYGSSYQSGLSNRAITAYTNEGNSIVFKLANVFFDGYIDSELKYIDKEGLEQVIKLTDEAKTEFKIDDDGIDLNEPIYYRSIFQPQNSVDLFYSDYAQFDQ